ncbi:hypothetical protein DFH11DRAFT_1706901 [Phellopilus nigrolimitatus]|nr:hypothetical protein DFH11DRAFT_1706901 [Phellopilus nigrolimitatus]
MRFISLFVVALTVASSPVGASWWSSDKPEYSSWDTSQLQTWLSEHNIKPPAGYSQKELQELVESNWASASSWSQDQYARAQQVFSDSKDTAFDTWDESRLRDFLLKQGVVAPSGPREKLVLAANQYYSGYTNAASSLASTASRTASTAVYGDSKYQASKSAGSLYSTASGSATSVAAQASQSLVRALDDSKDYVYSTWDDNRLRGYLEEKGVIKPEQQTTRDQLLGYMRDSYASAAAPVWNAWSSSYIHEWLVEHGIIKSDFQKNRDALVAQMQNYYYTPQQHVWDTWSESQLRNWLIEHNVIKSDAQVKQDKMKKLVADNYSHASDTIWAGWTESDLRSWLIAHGYIRSDVQAQREHLVKLINSKYNEANARSAAYLTWPDARLRAFLRNHGMPENALPTERPGLLQETRIRYVQTSSHLEQIYARLRALVASGVSSAEETLGQVLELLSGAERKTESKMHDAAADTDAYAKEKTEYAEKRAKDAKETVEKKKSEL